MLVTVMARRGGIRFLGVDWNLTSLIVFILGIIGFVIGILIILLSSPPHEADFIGIIISLSGLMVSLSAATKRQLSSVRDEVVSSLHRMEESLHSIEKILREVRDELRRRGSNVG